MSEQNMQSVQSIYASLRQGDVPAVLDRLSDQVEWSVNVAKSDVPWHTPARGKRSFVRFFGAFIEAVKLDALEPVAIVHSSSHVVALVRVSYTVRRNGRKVNQESVHWWTFDSDRKVARVRQFEDTAAVIAAYHADAPIGR